MPDLTLALTGVSASATVGGVSVRIENIKVRDEFVDTDGVNATSHSVNVGGPWVAHPASGASAFIASNRLTKDSSGSQALLMSTATVTGDGYVEAPVRMLTSISVNAGICISMNPSSDDYVFARHNRDDNLWSIRSTVPGSTTPLGTASETLSANDERLARLERRTTGGNDQYRLTVAGVVVIDWVTSNGHTGTRVGVRFGGAASSTTGYALERFEAAEYVVPSPDVTLALTGVSATGAVGTVTVSSPDVNVALTGVSATASVGSLTPSGGLPALSVCNLNVQHGTVTSGAEDFAWQIAEMTPGIDIVCMQERSTGVTGWDAGMAAAGFDEVVYRENGHGTDGPSIWVRTSRVTVNGTPFDHALSTGAIGWNGQNVDKAAVGCHVTVDGISFYVFNTHLAWSAGADSEGSTFSTIREAQLAELMSWIAGIVGSDPNVLLLGDMNFGPDYPAHVGGLQIDYILNEGYSDLWVQGIAEGKATADWNDRDSAGGADMPITSLTTRTHDTRRIDYFFLRDNAQMLLTAIDLPDLRENCSGALTGSPLRCPDVNSGQLTGTEDDYGVRPSDHNLMNLTLALTPDVTIDLTGVSAAGTAGSLAGERSVALSGLEATGSIGALQNTNTATVSGVSAAGSAGDLAASHSLAVSGNEATATPGSLAADHEQALSGVASSSGVGSVTIETAVALTGSAATGAVGTVSAAADTSLTLALSGVLATAAIGSLGQERTVTPSGVAATGEAGTLAPSTSIGISGNEAVGATGVLFVSQTLALSGIQASTAVGTLVAESDTSITINLSGVEAIGAVGSLSLQRELSLSGVAASLSLGVFGLSKSGSAALTGVEAIGAAGDIGPDTSTALSGVETAGEVSDLIAGRALEIAGVLGNGSAGSVSVSTTTALTGVEAMGHAGTLGIPSGKIDRSPSSRRYAKIADNGSTRVSISSGRTKAS